MTLASLGKIITAPAMPRENGSSAAWAVVEKELGIALPGDYKEYVNTFGTGKIADFVLPYNPFSDNRFLNLLKQVPKQVGTLRQMKKEFGDEECPYPLYPEPAWLLPWGCTDNGNILFWLTDGHPDKWPVVLSEGRGPGFEQFDESMTGFLTKLLSGEIVSQFFRGFSPSEAVFVPAKRE